MRSVIQPAIKPEALALVRQHQDAGDAVGIVTATNEFVTRPIADAFGVPELIAVELARDSTPGGDGWITGEIKGTPSFRAGKVDPLMEKVNHPVATNADERLRAIATQRGWRILDLF